MITTDIFRNSSSSLIKSFFKVLMCKSSVCLLYVTHFFHGHCITVYNCPSNKPLGKDPKADAEHGSQTIVDGTLYPYCSLSLATVKSHTDGKKCIFDQGFLSLQHSHFNCDWKPTTNYHLNCTFLYFVFSLLPLLLVVFLLASLFPFEPNQALFLVILSKEL